MEPVPEPEPAPGRTAVRSAAVMGKLTSGAGKFTNGYFTVPRSLLRTAAGEPIPDPPGDDQADDVTPTAIVTRGDADR